MLDCERARDLISLYVDGELAPDEKALLEEHLAGCGECSKLLSLYSELSLLMADDAEPPAELLAGVMSGVRDMKAEKKPKKKAGVIALRWAAVAASLALVSFVGLKVFGGGINMKESAVFDADSAESSKSPAPEYGYGGADDFSEDHGFASAYDYSSFAAAEGSSESVQADKCLILPEGADSGGFYIEESAPLSARGEAPAKETEEPDSNVMIEPVTQDGDFPAPEYTEDETVCGSGEWIRIVYEDGSADEALALVEELDCLSLCEFPDSNAIAFLPKPMDEGAVAYMVEQLEANAFIVSAEPEPAPQF